MTTINKYLGLNFFIPLNMFIIVLAETVGGGTLFFKLGIIHIIAIGFIILALTRIFYHYYTYDRFLEKFIHACLWPMAIFTISHVIEFLGLMVFFERPDTIHANVANFYLIGLLIITIGAESFLCILQGRPAHLLRLLIIASVCLALLSTTLLAHDQLISLDTNSSALTIYAIATIATTILTLSKIQQIKKRVDFMPSFVNYLSASVIFIGIAVLIDIYYKFFFNLFGLPEYQAVYFSHFAFYAALSFLFMAFSRVSHLGGMLEEVKRVDHTRKIQLS